MSPSIRLHTEIPGPRSRELMARREAAVARGVGYSVPLFVESASGALVTDERRSPRPADPLPLE